MLIELLELFEVLIVRQEVAFEIYYLGNADLRRLIFHAARQQHNDISSSWPSTFIFSITLSISISELFFQKALKLQPTLDFLGGNL